MLETRSALQQIALSKALDSAETLAVEARRSALARGLLPARAPSEEAFARSATTAEVLGVVQATGPIAS